MLFWLLAGVDAVVIGSVLFFDLVGLSAGSTPLSMIAIWAALLCGGVWLRQAGQDAAAIVLLALLGFACLTEVVPMVKPLFVETR